MGAWVVLLVLSRRIAHAEFGAQFLVVELGH